MGSVDAMTRTTTAIAALHPGAVDDTSSFAEITIDVADPGPHDLLVEVRAVSVNPVDVKTRAGFAQDEAPKVLGYDAAGVVTGTGGEVTGFKVGDEVYYAGSIALPGTNSQLHLVDERLVGHKPTTLSFAEAAALPLTSIAAWEALFDHLGLTANDSGSLLVVAGAGGVGSMVIQLARARTKVAVLATGGRPESSQFALDMGAHHIVDRHNLVGDVRGLAPDGVDWIFSPFSDGNVENYAEMLRPGGAVVAIDDPEALDVTPMKPKSLSWHWEFMFTRPLHAPEDTYQRDLLNELASLVDAGKVRSTMTTHLHPFNVDTLREAHRQVESSGSIGKVVISHDG